ncbi:hypothetical protein [Anaerocolumna sp. MB42-C2]|uniref:hypothetical protein n=1 Tax=Anaerocolumna sp. MB42-C2 TaxID=3070997 RepID=UPI0027DF44E5|nr:hypothetical protein [Anaerocolumna sp. MB42-C2]WMJ85687.1 hypothetical protein RBU59_16625 [Anaerocolumna sp. MB42-C2]
MKGNNLIHNWIILFVLGLSMCSLCIFYATTVEADTNLNKTNVINYIFSEENPDDFNIKLISNAKDEDIIDHAKQDIGYPLETYIEHNYKTLNIGGVEAFHLEDFNNGLVNLAIDYSLTKEKDRESSESAKAGIYDLGSIPFFYTGENPYWRIVNHNGSWGIGIPDIGIPDKILELIPENLTGFSGYNMVNSINQDAVKGTVVIGKFSPHTGEITEIKLSSLGLPQKINQELCANGEKESTLEIKTNYYFSVPLGINEKTSNEMRIPTMAANLQFLTNHPQIQGKITVTINIKVIHDTENNIP